MRRSAANEFATMAVVAMVAFLTAWPEHVARAATWREDFATAPREHGWQVQGDASLFSWNAAEQRLDVTWDSTRTNSFFHRPLGTILARDQDFRMAFDLRLGRIETASPDATFQIAVGFLLRRDAFRTNFFRGAGIQPTWGPRNLVEFDYFPASRSITPTFSAVGVATNNLRWAMGNLFPLELTPGDRFRIQLEHRSTTGNVTLSIWRNGEPYGETSTGFAPNFGDFRVDAFSITSYSGAHQPAGYGGQILAQGWIDDVELEYPDPDLPSPALTLPRGASPGFVQVDCPLRPGWVPILQTTADAVTWADDDAVPERLATGWRWSHPVRESGIGPAEFFRLSWDRP